VRSAAIEAGIEPRFVAAALEDVRAERLFPGVDRGRSLARRFFGTLLDAVTVRRTMRASPPDVLAIIMREFPLDPFQLVLLDQRGDPLNGGVIVEIQGIAYLKKPWLAAEVAMSAVRQIRVWIRPATDPVAGCEVTLRGPIAWSHNTGLVHGLVVSGIGGGIGAVGFGAAIGMVAGAIAFPPLALAVTGVSAAAGLASGTALGRTGYRAYCRHGIERAASALNRILLSVALHAEKGRPGSLPTDRPTPLPGTPDS
jgi:hypothetical protein